MTGMLFLYGWANGLVTVPALRGLALSAATAALSAGQIQTVDELADHLAQRRNERPLEGLLRVFLHAFALHGWIDSAPLQSGRLVMTRAGAKVLQLASAHLDMLDCASSYLDVASDLHLALHEPESATSRHCEEVRRAADLFARSWNIPTTGDAFEGRIRKHFIGHLNGAVLCPALVALGMPVFSASTGREIAPSVLQVIRAAGGAASLDQLQSQFPSAVLAPLIDLAVVSDVLTSDGTLVRLTASGRALVLEAANFGVVVSYARLLNSTARAIFESGQPSAGHGVDSFVNRAMNVWGSGRSTVLRRMRENIGPAVLSPLFDLPLDQQPAGIADMGAGSGGPLVDMATYVLRRTARGARTQDAPLIVIGADPSPVSRARMQGALEPLSQHAGVKCFILDADVGRPADYARAIGALGLRHPVTNAPLQADDLLHSQMFLLHDRELRLTHAEQAWRAGVDNWSTPRQRLSEDMRLTRDFSTARDIAVNLFDAPYAVNGAGVPGELVAADLVDLLEGWRPLIRSFGLVLVEPHLPDGKVVTQDVPDDATSIMPIEVDAGPVIWAAHALSNQFLITHRAQRAAFGLAGYAPLKELATGGAGVSLSWSADVGALYRDTARFNTRKVPDYAG